VAGTCRVAQVALWNAEDEGSSDAEAESGHEFDGCSYLFHDETYLTFSGDLGDASELTPDQVADASTDELTKLPHQLR
jgi:hypothetical protein